MSAPIAGLPYALRIAPANPGLPQETASPRRIGGARGPLRALGPPESGIGCSQALPRGRQTQAANRRMCEEYKL
jgi:hypothetical protein